MVLFSKPFDWQRFYEVREYIVFSDDQSDKISHPYFIFEMEVSKVYWFRVGTTNCDKLIE